MYYVIIVELYNMKYPYPELFYNQITNDSTEDVMLRQELLVPIECTLNTTDYMTSTIGYSVQGHDRCSFMFPGGTFFLGHSG